MRYLSTTALIALSALLATGCASSAPASAPAPARAPAPAAETPREPATDDAHNHDGSHPEGPENCGTNYMLPGEIARLGSHSFVILGQDDKDHVIADHRSGTPPHNYHYMLRVRLDPEEMSSYKKILKDSKTLPAFTTIYYDDRGEQKDRTFFCLSDLPKIFGREQKAGDSFERLFPIRASLQKNADHEGSFPIKASVVRGEAISLERKDVELLFAYYLPSYLPQDTLRTAIKANSRVAPLLNDAPLSQNESPETASKRTSYMKEFGAKGSGRDECPHDYYLKNAPLEKTRHSFLLLAETADNTVLAAHYYDMAPQNFQTIHRLKLKPEEMKVYRAAREGTKAIPLLQTDNMFCMADLREQIKSGKFSAQGTVYRDSNIEVYKPGAPVGRLELAADSVTVLMNRALNSLLNPEQVAHDVLGR